ncbi:hypothetical protein DRE_01799 [Drechslerella stenobrocha 248]|uniref:J domain-containing protein n=1 Tax=Drechslerella stenobrocha 248 TaxID=1043628 RepID=W7I942_9PEZI|nr:hypothetical protein DRE_01799 [Drechslerella stenobrocha 248]
MPSEAETIEFASLATSFYELLNIEPTAPAKDVRRAYRKTALQYHPDKNPDNPSAVEKFHLLTAAQEILCDVALRAAYDNAIAAKVARKRRTEAYDNKRRSMKEDLEARENSFKRQKTDADEQKNNLERLKEEGARRPAAAAEEEEQMDTVDTNVNARTPTGESKFSELDRTVKLKWRRKNGGELIDKASLVDLFSRFGDIDECVVVGSGKDREKEKKYASALLVFRNVVGAYDAVHRDTKALEAEDDEWGLFRDVVWASGKEPDLTFTTTATEAVSSPSTVGVDEPGNSKGSSSGDRFPSPSTGYKPTSKSAPSFGSFKASSFKKPAAAAEPSSLAEDMDYEATMLMRMKALATAKRREEQQKLTEELLQEEAKEDEQTRK